MPENSNTSGLLDRIREQLALMAKPGPIPLHPQVKEALRIIAEFLQGVEDGNTEENQQNELQDKAIQELKDLISGINAALVTIKADDEATKTTILGIQTELEGIKTRLDNADTDLVGKINAALEPLLSALETLRGQDLAHTGRMNELESGLNALLQKIGNLPDESTLAELLSILQDNRASNIHHRPPG
jgi:predicted  nucleic acid-binding Zn-ribbon protein